MLTSVTVPDFMRGTEAAFRTSLIGVGHPDARVTVVMHGRTAAVSWEPAQPAQGLNAQPLRVRLYMPTMKLTARLSRAEADRMTGYWLHELGHTLHSDATIMQETASEDRRLPRIMNALEDPRMEDCVIRAGYAPGARRVLHALVASLWHKAVANGWHAGDRGNVAWTIAAMGRAIVYGYPLPGAQTMIDAAPDDVRQILDIAFAAMRDASTQRDMLPAGRAIVAIMDQHDAETGEDDVTPPEPPQTPADSDNSNSEGSDSDPCDDGDSGDSEASNGESGDGESGDGESGDGESGDGESGDGESGDGESGDGESGDGESGDGESGDGESGDGESGDGESPAGTEDLSQSQRDDDGSDGNSSSNSDGNSGTDRGGATNTAADQDRHDPYGDGGDAEPDAGDLADEINDRSADDGIEPWEYHSDPDMRWYYRNAVANGAAHPGTIYQPKMAPDARTINVKQLRDKIPNAGRIKRDIAALIRSPAKSWNDRQQDSGRLDPTRLARGMAGENRVFLRRRETEGDDALVWFLIDLSGSMTARSCGVAASLALHLCEAIETQAGRCAIFGFEDGHDPDGIPMIDAAQLRVLKAENQRVRATHELSRLSTLTDNSTPLSHGLLTAANAMAAQDATRRVLVVLTDGGCNAGDHCVAAAVAYAESIGVTTVGLTLDYAGQAFPVCERISSRKPSSVARTGLAAVRKALQGRPL